MPEKSSRSSRSHVRHLYALRAANRQKSKSMAVFVHGCNGNLLDATVEALVNTVNCVGVMGKGLALSFKLRYPLNYGAYRDACNAGLVRPGRIYTHVRTQAGLRRVIFNFPTKQHWRDPSRLEWIDSGLEDLTLQIKAHKVRSIAVPALGCQNGGLSYGDVQPKIVNALAEIDDLTVLMYAPQG